MSVYVFLGSVKSVSICGSMSVHHCRGGPCGACVCVRSMCKLFALIVSRLPIVVWVRRLRPLLCRVLWPSCVSVFMHGWQ